MSILKTITRNKRIRKGLKAATVILLLAIYIAGGTSCGAFHRLLHQDKSVISHSSEEEKDPCHRVIYHFEKDNVCKHDSHFSVKEKCGQCHILCKSDQITVWISSNESVAPHTLTSASLTFACLAQISFDHPSRAPPLT
jgi:hypothetical protein